MITRSRLDIGMAFFIHRGASTTAARRAVCMHTRRALLTLVPVVGTRRSSSWERRYGRGRPGEMSVRSAGMCSGRRRPAGGRLDDAEVRRDTTGHSGTTGGQSGTTNRASSRDATSLTTSAGHQARRALSTRTHWTGERRRLLPRGFHNALLARCAADTLLVQLALLFADNAGLWNGRLSRSAQEHNRHEHVLANGHRATSIYLIKWHFFKKFYTFIIQLR